MKKKPGHLKLLASEISNVAEIYALSVDNKFIKYNMYLYSLITGFERKEGKDTSWSKIVLRSI